MKKLSLLLAFILLIQSTSIGQNADSTTVFVNNIIEYENTTDIDSLENQTQVEETEVVYLEQQEKLKKREARKQKSKLALYSAGTIIGLVVLKKVVKSVTGLELDLSHF